MKRVLKNIPSTRPDSENSHNVNDFKFSIDKDLLLHPFFADLLDELQVKHISTTYKLLIHYCSHIMLRDNPGRRFTSNDNCQVVKILLSEYGLLFKTKRGRVRFRAALGQRNSNRKFLKKATKEELDKVLDVNGKREKKIEAVPGDLEVEALVADIESRKNDEQQNTQLNNDATEQHSDPRNNETSNEDEDTDTSDIENSNMCDSSSEDEEPVQQEANVVKNKKRCLQPPTQNRKQQRIVRGKVDKKANEIIGFNECLKKLERPLGSRRLQLGNR